MGQGIRQLRVDLDDRRGARAQPRALWSGTGLHAPEGPHLYRRGDDWYLLIAEGGTERGHTVAIARGNSPEGPFEGFAGNPILTARSTSSPVQNIGHADLVEAPDGGTALVALGVRPGGFTRSFSPLGRETFLTRVEWVDGWPQVEPIVVAPGIVRWSSRSTPRSRSSSPDGSRSAGAQPISSPIDDAGRLVLTGHGTDLSDPLPSFVGRRQAHVGVTFSARVDATQGVGGIAARHSEAHWFGIDAHDDGAVTTVTARAALAGFTHEWRAKLPAGDVVLSIRSRPSSNDLANARSRRRPYRAGRGIRRRPGERSRPHRTGRPLLGLRDDGILHRPRAGPLRDRRPQWRSPTSSIGVGHDSNQHRSPRGLA